MKKILFLLLGTQLAFSAGAQVAASHADSLLSRWCLDVNVKGGLLSQNFTTINSLGNYPNAVSSNTGDLKFKNGKALGGDIQLGYFFGHKRHFGVGVGFNYTYQTGDVTLNNYHVEFQSTDFQNNIFRQLITANYLTENQTMTNMNIPLVLKYKNRFSKHWGFTADAGALINVQMSNSYKTDASFNYEAVYKFVDIAHTITAYDNAPVASTNDYFITKSNFYKDNSGGNVQAYFDGLHTTGYNVGVNVKPTVNSGKVNYTTGSIGLILKPSVNFFLSDKIVLDLGLYYSYQSFKNNAVSNYQLTNKVGDYSSVLNSVSKTNAQSYGVNLGVRFFLCNPKDRDHDGVPDKKDLCPDDSGSILLQGCPDTDGDGILDKNDSCPKVKGIAKFFGCPDTDGDGIQDKEDECPLIAGLIQFHGCPDTDGDGIPDKDDECPTVKGFAQFHGCPDTDGDGIPDHEDKCPDVFGVFANHGCPEIKVDTNISTPILFDVNQTTIKESSLPILIKAAQDLKAGKLISIRVDGYTDNTGPLPYNNALSVKRAAAVKAYLISLGVPAKKIVIVGNGPKMPIDTNDTPEGRAKNRRAVMDPKGK